MNKRDYLKEFIETTNLKYQRKYIPNTLTEKEKNKVAKYLIEIKEGKIEEPTTQLRRPRKSTFTIQFNKKYGGLKDKSIKNLAKYFKIQPIILNTIYDKANALWYTSNSRLRIPQKEWSNAKLYKSILIIMKSRETGQILKTDNKSLIEKAVNFNSYIPPDIISGSF